MLVTSLKLQNFRSFEETEAIELDQINILIGSNNAGKSSIIRALHLLQDDHGQTYQDIKIGNHSARISIGLKDIDTNKWKQYKDVRGLLNILLEQNHSFPNSTKISYTLNNDYNNKEISPFENKDPNHFIVPFLSKRKTTVFQEDIKKTHTLTVSGNLSFLAAKLLRVGNKSHPKHEQYNETCTKILEYILTALSSDYGVRPGTYLSDSNEIYIEQMGEGVAHIVGLLADLALSSGKLFLIEEPENDLHPKALKALLELILKSSKKNQFVISTHSNIVVRHLASATNSKLFNVKAKTNRLPSISTIHEVENTVEARLEILSELGYSFSDFNLWDGWLILEESSAEKIIRDYLIPWFTPKLARIRTIAAGGVSKVEPVFRDFNHLEQLSAN